MHGADRHVAGNLHNTQHLASKSNYLEPVRTECNYALATRRNVNQLARHLLRGKLAAIPSNRKTKTGSKLRQLRIVPTLVRRTQGNGRATALLNEVCPNLPVHANGKDSAFAGGPG